MKKSLHINFTHMAFNNPFYLVILLYLIDQKCIFYYINSSKMSSFSPGVAYDTVRDLGHNSRQKMSFMKSHHTYIIIHVSRSEFYGDSKFGH